MTKEELEAWARKRCGCDCDGSDRECISGYLIEGASYGYLRGLEAAAALYVPGGNPVLWHQRIIALIEKEKARG
jgi:hypothetical protein